MNWMMQLRYSFDGGTCDYREAVVSPVAGQRGNMSVATCSDLLDILIALVVILKGQIISDNSSRRQAFPMDQLTFPKKRILTPKTMQRYPNSSYSTQIYASCHVTLRQLIVLCDIY